jgi:hypothetical protein
MPELAYLRPRAASRVRPRRPSPRASPSRHARRPDELRFHSTRRPLGLPSTSPRPHRSSKSYALPCTSLLLARLPAAAGTAAARRREPSPALLPPIPSHQIGSRRAGGRSPTFPWPRAAADSPESSHLHRRPTPGTQLRTRRNLASKPYMWVQWTSIGAVMLKKHFSKVLVIYCLIKRLKALLKD